MPDIRTANYRQELETALEESVSVDVGVAFASAHGLRFGNIDVKLESLLKTGGRVRILVDLRLGNTHPDFLAQVIQWQTEGLNIECRHYDTDNGIFHPKLYIFNLRNGSTRVITGSANWTGEAYSTNVEHGIVIDGDPSEEILVEIRGLFEELWDAQHARVIGSGSLEIYRAYWRRWRGLERKSRRRTSGLWGRLRGQLTSERQAIGFRWPSRDAAFLLGTLAARGEIDFQNRLLRVRLRYGGSALRHDGRVGYIGKGDVAFRVADVAPLVPRAIADRISRVVSPSIPNVNQTGRWTYVIEVDCEGNSQLIDHLRNLFGRGTDYQTFRVPREILETTDRELQEEFMRGYALACGLASSGTYDPVGNHQVWFRPATANIRQFEQIESLLEDSIGFAVTTHHRPDRDVAVKVRCEAWLEIGFGVDWLDSIVEEGARLNGALAPPQVP